MSSFNITNKIVNPEDTIVGKGNYFIIKLNRNAFYEANKNFYRLSKDSTREGIEGFKGICTENISFNFNTTWEDSGGAKLAKKLAGYLDLKIIKALAGQSDSGYLPIILTDGYTQQKLKDSEPLKCDLKFKLYHEDTVAGTNYHDAFLFLTHICSPIKEPMFGTAAKEMIVKAANGIYNTGSTLQNSIKEFASGDTRGISNAAKTFVNTASNLFDEVTTKTSNGKNNGNFTVTLSLGNKIFEHNNVDWIIKSFSLSPSTQFIWDENKKLPMPIWCDFNVSLETRLKLSNKYVYDLLNKEQIKIVNS